MGERWVARGVHGGYVEHPSKQHEVPARHDTRAELDALRYEINPRDRDWAILMNRAEEFRLRGENLQRMLALRYDLPVDAPWDDIRPLWEKYEKQHWSRHFHLPDDASWAQIDSLRGEDERVAEGSGHITVKPPPIAGL